jgi:hypothetical protein
LFLLKLNPIEPPWYGPVCPVVGEGRRREASPYPDLRRTAVVRHSIGVGRQRAESGHRSVGECADEGRHGSLDVDTARSRSDGIRCDGKIILRACTQPRDRAPSHSTDRV